MSSSIDISLDRMNALQLHGVNFRLLKNFSSLIKNLIQIQIIHVNFRSEAKKKRCAREETQEVHKEGWRL